MFETCGKYIQPRLAKHEKICADYAENIHYLLCKSRGGSNRDINKEKVFMPVHNAFHRFFGNGTVQEQMYQLLGRNDKALTKEFKEDLMKIICESDQTYYYEKGVFK